MKNIIMNGPPKCGNHMLVKACELLGVNADVNHITFSDENSLIHNAEKHIFIKRDPRNLPISLLRAEEKPITIGMSLTKFNYITNGTLVKELNSYSGWLRDPKTLVVSFESLLKDDKELKRIANYLEVPYINEAFENISGHTVTWVDNNHSNFLNLWCEQLEDVWNTEGGIEVQKLYGY